MTIQPLLQPLLIQIMSNESNTTTQHKQPIQCPNLYVLGRFFRCKRPRMSQQIHKQDTYGPIHVQNKIILLLRGDVLDLEGVVQEGRGGKALMRKVHQDTNTEIRVGFGFNFMTDAEDELIGFTGGVHEFLGRPSLVVGHAELFRGAVQCPAESISNGQQSRTEGGNQILPCTRCDNGIMRPGNGRTMIRSQHQDHLNEFTGVLGQTALEPQQRQHPTNTDFVFKDPTDGHTGVQEFLTTVIADGGDEGGGFTDESEFLGPGVVDGDFGGFGVGFGDELTIGTELFVEGGEEVREGFKGVGDQGACVAEGLVFGEGGFGVAAGTGTGVSELDFGSKLTMRN